MMKGTMVTLCLMVVLSIVILLANPGFSQMQDIEGNVICVEVDEKGNVNGMDQFTECDGVFMVVGKDGKLYTVYGTDDGKKPKEKGQRTSWW